MHRDVLEDNQVLFITRFLTIHSQKTIQASHIHIRFPSTKNAVNEHLDCQAVFCATFPALLSENITCSLTTTITPQTYPKQPTIITEHKTEV